MGIKWDSEVPNFHESLDACAQFEATLTFSEKEDYAHNLYDFTTDTLHDYEEVNWETVFQIATATAPQRCEAFLRMKGKWI